MENAHILSAEGGDVDLSARGAYCAFSCYRFTYTGVGWFVQRGGVLCLKLHFSNNNYGFRYLKRNIAQLSVRNKGICIVL